MATHGRPSPRVLVLGHSFIRRLRDFIERNPGDLDLAFKLDGYLEDDILTSKTMEL